jgi:glycine/D-amino acid oxidase-like deaminating enzyme
MKRRDFLGSLIAAPALVGLTRKSPRALAGGFVDDGGSLGHALRDGVIQPSTTPPRRVPLVIVGGGIAGLSAGWELDRRGMRDFVLLELEHHAGGNSRSGENEITAYPWAAHYVPVPGPKATLARELFEEMGVLRDGVWDERHLCFSPQERLFLHGEWHTGIEPEYAITPAGRDAFRRFDEEIERARATGEFTIPMEHGVRRDSILDTQSMARWMRDRNLGTPALNWYLDYACRDDYGATALDVSAWAGIHYFASRAHEEQGPLTWPEGNGWIAKHLVARLGARIRTSEPVVSIEPQGSSWLVRTPQAQYLAPSVIFAAPSMLLPVIAPGVLPRNWKSPLVYSPWLTANLTLDRLPHESTHGAPLSWDNVIYDSPSLGYVDATHQSLRTREERSVWTYYWTLANGTPQYGRELLLRRPWTEWTELILRDLERVHRDIRACVARIDVMRMGHAMVRPTPGFLSATKQVAALERPGFYLANSDLSGLSLFEEAQFRGVAAARRALNRG